jgi:hypothetical protein
VQGAVGAVGGGAISSIAAAAFDAIGTLVASVVVGPGGGTQVLKVASGST